VKYVRHSPSSLNLFAAQPSMFVLEKILGHRQPGSAPMYRGTAVEDGVTHGLKNLDAPLDDCVSAAYATYDRISALSGDKRRESFRDDIQNMVKMALEELRPYGSPSDYQKAIEWKPEGLKYPVFGYLDYFWQDHNLTLDLKTSSTLSSTVKIGHARQVSFYCTSNNSDARIAYIAPKKRAVYQVENINGHRASLVEIAKRCENFLVLSYDPQFYTSITVPDLESFYWSGPAARELAFSIWKV
jgi:hypothetical protein